METEQQIVDNYIATGKVYFVYRSDGEAIGPESLASAEAAYCAGDQNKYWEYHDILFVNLTGENVGDYTDQRLIAFAQKLGLNMTDFKACFTGEKYKTRAEQDQTDGEAAGAQGTPSFIINGQPFIGAQPYANFQQAIEAALTGK